MANKALSRGFTVEDCKAVVQVPRVDPVWMSVVQRREALAAVGKAEAQLAAWKACLIRAERKQSGEEVAKQVLRNKLQASRQQASRDVETSTQLQEVPTASKALEAGIIPSGHARLIAKAASEGTIDEALLTKAAQQENYDRFAKIVRRHQIEMSKDNGQSIFERQRDKRSARAFFSRENGMFVLSGEFDPTTGAHIDTVLAAKERELWNKENPKKRRTPQQRMADALAELICEPGKGKAKGTALMVVADYDVLNQELVNARLADGTPIPTSELIRLACNADLLPGVFRRATQEMNLGRKRRTASQTQRAALIYRDKECIGCGASAHRSFAHHIRFWQHGGLTNMSNLVLVCNKCHHNIHDEHWQVTQNTTTKRFKITPPPKPVPNTKPAKKTEANYSQQHNPILLN